MTENTLPANADTAFSPLRFDAEDYLRYVEGVQVGEAEAREFLEALWKIMVAFVDLGFDLKTEDGPVSQIVKAAIELEGESRGLLELRQQFHEQQDEKTDVHPGRDARPGTEDS